MTETMELTAPEDMVATTEKKYTVQITSKSYESKPDKDEVVKIQQRISLSSLNGTKDHIAKYLVNGYGVTTGVLTPGHSNTNNNVQYNEALMVDFDNDKNDVDSKLIDKALANKWIKENVAFIYETFSSTPNWPRFRAAIFLTEPIDADKVSSTYEYIYDQLVEDGMERRHIDTGAKNPSRLFFGSQSGTYTEVNMDNEWEPKQKEKPVRNTSTNHAVAQSGTDPIEYDEGLAIMEAFVDLEQERLVDADNAQNNWLDAMFTLYGNFVDEQITEDQALEYAEVLASGNGEWAENNYTRMKKMIDGQEDKREVFSFRDKFQRPISYADSDCEIAQDYQRRIYDGRTLKEVNEAKSKAITAQPSPFELLPATKPDNRTFQKYAGDLLSVARNADGSIHSIGSQINSATKIKFHDEIAMIVAEYTKANSVNGDLYIRPKGLGYWATGDELLERVIDDAVGTMNMKNMLEVKRILRRRATTYTTNSDCVQLNNQYHLYDGEIVKGWTDKYTPYYLDVSYNPDAYSKDVDDFLNMIADGDDDMRVYLEGIIGDILLRNNKAEAIFFLSGGKKQSGGTGKSTFGGMLKNFVNGNDSESAKEQKESSFGKPRMGSSIPIEQLSDNTTALSLNSRMLNFGAETGMGYLKDTSALKSLVSSDDVEQRGAYRDGPSELQSTATMMFATNRMPDMEDDTNAMEQRNHIIIFEKTFRNTDKEDKLLGQKLSTREAQSYLLNLGLKGVQYMKANGRKLPKPERVLKAVAEYSLTSDAIAQYVKEKNEDSELNDTPSAILEIDHQLVYSAFSDWCKATGYANRSRKTFETRMLTLGYDLERSSKKIIMYGGKSGRPNVFIRSSGTADKYDLFHDFIDKNDINNKYWVDTYFEYVDTADEKDIAPLKRKEFNERVIARGYEKKKAAKVFTNKEGEKGRHMVYCYDTTLDERRAYAALFKANKQKEKEKE